MRRGLVVALVAVAGAAGCGGSDDTTLGPDATAVADGFVRALVADGDPEAAAGLASEEVGGSLQLWHDYLLRGGVQTVEAPGSVRSNCVRAFPVYGPTKSGELHRVPARRPQAAGGVRRDARDHGAPPGVGRPRRRRAAGDRLRLHAEPRGPVRRRLPEGFELDDDPARVDVDELHRFLSTEAYWALGRTRDVVERLVRQATRVVGLYHGVRQIGFARAFSDGVTIAYLADVYVHPDFRGRGLGEELVREIVDSGPLASRKWILHTENAHDLYRKLGFGDPSRKVMERL